MQKKPNIIIITTHDTGRHFGCYGVPSVATPAIDRLAGEGVRFDNMFATSSICSPSRGSLMTGRYPQSNGLTGLAGKNWGSEFNDTKQHLSHVLRDAGYHTVFFGHQHETAELSTLGFDDISGAHRAMLTAPFARVDPGGKPESLADGCKRSSKNAPETASDASSFIKNAAAKEMPFFMQIGFFETHTPYLWGGCEPDDSKGVYLPPYTQSTADTVWQDKVLGPHVAGLQGSIRMVDKAVEIILNALDAGGLADDTLVLFTVDHGPELPRAKWTMSDGGIRVAFIMRWPAGGIAGGKSCDQLLSNVDFLPTLADIAGVPIPKNVEGRSFAWALPGGSGTCEKPRDTVYAMFSYVHTYCARTAAYKIIRDFSETPSTELYDLREDPLELRDVAYDARYAGARADMEARLSAWLDAVGDPIERG